MTVFGFPVTLSGVVTVLTIPGTLWGALVARRYHKETKEALMGLQADLRDLATRMDGAMDMQIRVGAPDVTKAADRLDAAQKAVQDLMDAAFWTADKPCDGGALWKALRQSVGLN